MNNHGIVCRSDPVGTAMRDASVAYSIPANRPRDLRSWNAGLVAQRLASGRRDKALTNWREAYWRRKDACWHKARQFYAGLEVMP